MQLSQFFRFFINFIVFRTDFDETVSEFYEISAKYCQILLFQKKQEFQLDSPANR